MASGLTESSDLVLEDGTGKATSNSYVSIATVTAYANLRQDANLDSWALANESNRVAAIIVATQYIDLRWVWEGIITVPGSTTPLVLTQRLQWPRDGVFDDRGIAVEDDELPERLTDAVCEYAARAIDPATKQAVALLIDLTSQDDAGRSVIETLDRIGPLQEFRKYDKGAGRRTWRDYGNADRIVRQSGFLGQQGERAVRV